MIACSDERVMGERKIDPGFPPAPVSEEAKEAFNDDWMLGDEKQVKRFYKLLI